MGQSKSENKDGEWKPNEAQGKTLNNQSTVEHDHTCRV